MLDRRFIVENATVVKQNCANRGVSCDVDRFLELEGKRKALLLQVEDFNRQANEVAKTIGKGISAERFKTFMSMAHKLLALEIASVSGPSKETLQQQYLSRGVEAATRWLQPASATRSGLSLGMAKRLRSGAGVPQV